MNLFEKICLAHDIDIRKDTLSIYPDQALTHDGTGTSLFLQLEAIGITRIKPFTVVYVDHNTLQVGYPNPDDHRYLKAMAAKLGAIFSLPGNGICHQVHLENFTRPGQILVGSDSHTSTAGGLASLGFGAGGLDVALALSGEPFRLPRPKVYGVHLSGELPQWTSGKDVILNLLGRLSVQGGIGAILEFFGPGVSQLSVCDRATICNMAAETGATSALFPADERSREFLKQFGRDHDYAPWLADVNATYDKTVEIDLDTLEPMIALPHSPDRVKPVSEVSGTPVQQICIGSCTNSSFRDLAIAARLLKNRSVHPDTTLVVSPGSRRTLTAIAQSNDMELLIRAGARILEPACGPCNGIGLSPESGANTLRTHNRNFRGRCGTIDARSFLCSAEVAAVSTLTGVITDPRNYGDPPVIEHPRFIPDIPDLFLLPSARAESVPVVKGPNIRAIPVGKPPEKTLHAKVALKLGDDVTTDDIIPGGAKMLSLRSNVPDSVTYLFQRVDSEFAGRIKRFAPQWIVVGGEHYGQGSAREHAVMVPMFAGLRLVIAKSFARIYRQNCINFGVIPLVFSDIADYDHIDIEDDLKIESLAEQLLKSRVRVINVTKKMEFNAETQCNDRETKIIIEGGMLNHLKRKNMQK